MELGEVDRATEWCNRALAIDPDDPRLQYNMACLYSIAGKTEQALEHFEIAIGVGYASREWIDNDPDVDARTFSPSRMKSAAASERLFTAPASTHASRVLAVFLSRRTITT